MPVSSNAVHTTIQTSPITAQQMQGTLSTNIQRLVTDSEPLIQPVSVQPASTQHMLQLTQLNIQKTQVQVQVSTQADTTPILLPTPQQQTMSTQGDTPDQRQLQPQLQTAELMDPKRQIQSNTGDQSHQCHHQDMHLSLQHTKEVKGKGFIDEGASNTPLLFPLPGIVTSRKSTK